MAEFGAALAPGHDLVAKKQAHGFFHEFGLRRIDSDR